jgi:hypothetical protein
MSGEVAQEADEIDELAATLDVGDQILFDTSSEPFLVADRWTRPVTTSIRSGDEYQIVELERDDGLFHLVFVEGDGVKPLLYHSGEWTQEDGRYRHHGKGKRVYTLRIGARGLATQQE